MLHTVVVVMVVTVGWWKPQVAIERRRSHCQRSAQHRTGDSV